jgi:cyclic pyranopterin monophosphate synthase
MTMPGRPGDQGTGRLTHVDEHGKAHMVDITGKAPTLRIAEAQCLVLTAADVSNVLADPAVGPGLLEAARFAGMLAAKQTSSLVPLCHPIRLDGVALDVQQVSGGFRIITEVAIIDRTGVEMEALTACAAAALVLLQPLLEVDPSTSIEGLTLWRKTGGRSGTWQRVEGGGMRNEGKSSLSR